MAVQPHRRCCAGKDPGQPGAAREGTGKVSRRHAHIAKRVGPSTGAQKWTVFYVVAGAHATTPHGRGARAAVRWPRTRTNTGRCRRPTPTQCSRCCPACSTLRSRCCRRGLRTGVDEGRCVANQREARGCGQSSRPARVVLARAGRPLSMCGCGTGVSSVRAAGGKEQERTGSLQGAAKALPNPGPLAAAPAALCGSHARVRWPGAYRHSFRRRF